MEKNKNDVGKEMVYRTYLVILAGLHAQPCNKSIEKILIFSYSTLLDSLSKLYIYIYIYIYILYIYIVILIDR